jgi:hypothetical protein
MGTGGLIVVVPPIFRKVTRSTIEASAGRTQSPAKKVPDMSNAFNILTLKEAALIYAAKGLNIFPCGVDKKPHVKDWSNAATTDQNQVRRWWTECPTASIGCPTGALSGVWVLDVGLPDGPASLATLEAKHGPLPVTVEQITGSGGRHLSFQWVEGRPIRNSAGKLGPGLDVRGERGYVILPPSGHPCGGRYSWVAAKGTPVAEAPDWLMDLVAPLPRVGGAQ